MSMSTVAEAVSILSFGVSAASLLFTVAAYRKLDDAASETFAVIGADEGNHEARLERLEHKVGIPTIPSPSALEDAGFASAESQVNPDGFAYAFGDEFESTELQGAEDVDLHTFENEGGAVPAYPHAEVKS